MQQSIRYKGLSLTPDEMAVENGALALCGNLELHDGALRPAIVAGTPLSQPLTVNGEVAKILYVHETGSYHHLIAIASSSIYWFMQDGTLGSSTPIKSFDYGSTILSINSIGNTLIITATDGIHYAQWKEGSYYYLGQKPPFLPISFGLSYNHTESYTHGGGLVTTGSIDETDYVWQQTTVSSADVLSAAKASADFHSPGQTAYSIKEEKQSDITQSLWALINRTNNLIAKNGRFYANFLVRYCYRLYDGTMIMHSAPVLMPVLVPNNFKVYYTNGWAKSTKPENPVGSEVTGAKDFEYDDSFEQRITDSSGESVFSMKVNKLTMTYYPRNVSLQYTIRSYSLIQELKQWNDIIKSVDIFISTPILKADQSEKVVSFNVTEACYGLGKGLFESISTRTLNGKLRGYGVITVNIPSLSDSAYADKIKNTSALYKVASLQVDELSTAYHAEVPVDKSAVYNISTQEQMKDDYKTHNSLFAKGTYAYNHRLNLYGMSEKLFSGFSPFEMFPYPPYPSNFYNGSNVTISKIVVQLKTTEGFKYVECSGSNIKTELYTLINMPKFYPDSRAEKMIIFTDGGDIYEFVLKECNELNGAMHMGDFSYSPSKYRISSFSYSVDDVVDMSNKIYTSESDNPFYFPLNGINTVGIGIIQGIASTTRALSQGQFGQYPLMAFSTDGIWALEVSSQGTYSSIHPISREVCSNPKSITQLDQSVLFATNRSLSRIAESQVVSMSDVLDGPDFNIVSNLGKFFNFFIAAEGDDAATKTIKAQMRQLIDFTSSPIDFFQRCQVIYDYKNSRIFCLDVSQQTKEASADTVALCYSIKDNAWSTFLIQNVLTSINSYPHPYIQYRDGSVMVLDKGYDYEDPTEYHGIIVTRTLKFDEDNVPDSITGYIHSLTSGSIPIMWLYGSNDNQNWHYIGRLGGMKSSYMATHSYRFFRIALYLKMKSMNQYFATSLEVIRRFNKF